MAAGRRRGFWVGFLTGTALAAGLAFALAAQFRVPLPPPALKPAALEAPAFPDAPGGPGEAPQAVALVRPTAAGPLIGSPPAPDVPPRDLIGGPTARPGAVPVQASPSELSRSNRQPAG